jgi:hypothetical protein
VLHDIKETDNQVTEAMHTYPKVEGQSHLYSWMSVLDDSSERCGVVRILLPQLPSSIMTVYATDGRYSRCYTFSDEDVLDDSPVAPIPHIIVPLEH